MAAFLEWSESIRTAVNQALTTAAGLSVSEFELMSRLWSQPAHELAQRDLTAALGWSRSRVSHLLRRLEKRGFVERYSPRGREQDLRLTTQGLQHLEDGQAAYHQKSREVLLDQLTPIQRNILHDVMNDPPSSDLSPRPLERHSNPPARTPHASDTRPS